MDLQIAAKEPLSEPRCPVARAGLNGTAERRVDKEGKRKKPPLISDTIVNVPNFRH